MKRLKIFVGHETKKTQTSCLKVNASLKVEGRKMKANQEKLCGLMIFVVMFAGLFLITRTCCANAEPSSTWTIESGIRLEGEGSFGPHAPDVVELPDGTYRMYFIDRNNGHQLVLKVQYLPMVWYGPGKAALE